MQKHFPTTENKQNQNKMQEHTARIIQQEQLSLYSQSNLLSSIWRKVKDTGWSQMAEVYDYQLKENKTFMILRGEPIQIS